MVIAMRCSPRLVVLFAGVVLVSLAVAAGGAAQPVLPTSPERPMPALSENEAQGFALQVRLDRAGFSSGVIDGRPGPKTAAALAQFQQALGVVLGVERGTLAASFHEPRGAAAHEAMDIPAARGTPVVAVEDGTITKLFTSIPGGPTVYQYDPSRAYAHYYAHLDRCADGLAEGDPVVRGQLLG
jgi:peptidoglycan LD-endopeptidase LytH